MYGTQTSRLSVIPFSSFENDVKMYGTQTDGRLLKRKVVFENDVKIYGILAIGGVIWTIKRSLLLQCPDYYFGVCLRRIQVHNKIFR